ncbi:hypothetical protein G9C98_004417 [Cotesia typhae]|uniref:Large ribosomal subunit protein mL40 n=1 Tax=Cotesia typhae TaxID=2053667 RepID=A0A8J5UUE6_9HYME|nr:hypothetical protein G9C98_004417 [Cotesia typhae]
MSFLSALAKQSRVLLNPVLIQCPQRNIFTDISPVCFKITDTLFGEPLKRKKRLDPSIIRHREERKRRKLEKHIRRLEKHSRKLKPITECQVPFKLIDELKQRTRPKPELTPEVLEERTLLLKDWSRYKHRQHVEDVMTIESMIASQHRALEELKAESQDLYDAAIELDMSLLLLEVSGPTWTPPIPNYDMPDGDYFDISKKWEGE